MSFEAIGRDSPATNFDGFEIPQQSFRSEGVAWRTQKSCDLESSHLFYPNYTESLKTKSDGTQEISFKSEPEPQRRRREAAAKAICSMCLVQQQCLNWALTKPERLGIWGGKTEEERRRTSRRRNSY